MIANRWAEICTAELEGTTQKYKALGKDKF